MFGFPSCLMDEIPWCSILLHVCLMYIQSPPIPFMHFSDVVSIFRSDDVIDELRIGLLNELHDIMFKVIYIFGFNILVVLPKVRSNVWLNLSLIARKLSIFEVTSPVTSTFTHQDSTVSYRYFFSH